MHRHAFFVLALMAGWAAGTLSASASGLGNPADSLHPSLKWRRAHVRTGVGSEGFRALAVDTQRQGIAVGSASGVSVFQDGLLQQRISPLNGVTDLAFTDRGTLWIGTRQYLWRWQPDGTLEMQSPGQGEKARSIHRIATLGTLTVVTTDAGVYARLRDGSWRRLGADLPRAVGGALALRWQTDQAAGGQGVAEIWLVVGGQLWRTTASVGEAPPSAAVSETARVLTIAEAPVSQVPVQVVFDLAGVDALLVYPRLLAYRVVPEGHWKIARPVGVPDADFLWIAHADGEFWLGTKGGVLRCGSLDGNWWRAAPPLGGLETHRIASLEGRVLAATSRGLYEGVRDVPRFADDEGWGPVGAAERRDPDIRLVQRAAVFYQGLDPRYMRSLRSGVERRGWWPDVSLRLQGGLAEQSGADFDEAYVSGGMRSLRDRDRADAMEIDASLVFSWDLGDVVFNPEAVDLSREARQVIALRDDVLDQINQLYYERQAILLALESQDMSSSLEASRLRLRAAELAAGLDGWTGGWFQKQLHETQREEMPLR